VAPLKAAHAGEGVLRLNAREEIIALVGLPLGLEQQGLGGGILVSALGFYRLVVEKPETETGTGDVCWHRDISSAGQCPSSVGGHQ
jgi:hypothetical protein